MFLLEKRHPILIFSLTHVLEQQLHLIGSFFRRIMSTFFKGPILFSPPLPPLLLSLEPDFLQNSTQIPEFTTKQALLLFGFF